MNNESDEEENNCKIDLVSNIDPQTESPKTSVTVDTLDSIKDLGQQVLHRARNIIEQHDLILKDAEESEGILRQEKEVERMKEEMEKTEELERLQRLKEEMEKTEELERLQRLKEEMEKTEELERLRKLQSDVAMLETQPTTEVLQTQQSTDDLDHEAIQATHDILANSVLEGKLIDSDSKVDEVLQTRPTVTDLGSEAARVTHDIIGSSVEETSCQTKKA